MNKPENLRSRFADVVPVPDHNYVVPDDEDFAQWAQHPITRFVAACFEIAANKNREQWEELSWMQGNCEATTLVELRTRADAYLAFSQTKKEDYEQLISK